jgi:threonine dehydrogenase-like Zn-dependent dehydrogenase
MKAVVFHYNLPRFAFAYLLGLATPRAYLAAPGPLALKEIPEPELPYDDWAIVRTRLCGICGSDLKEVFLEGSFDNPLTALISFPAVLGHEVVGTVERVGPRVTSLRVGERVVLNPWLSCGPGSAKGSALISAVTPASSRHWSPSGSGRYAQFTAAPSQGFS